MVGAYCSVLNVDICIYNSVYIIRIFNGCEVRIHEGNCLASRDLLCDAKELSPSTGIINSHRITIMDSFSCILVFLQLR